MKKWMILIGVGVLTTQVCAASPHVKVAQETIGNAKAPQGGTMYQVVDSEPEQINPISSSDLYSQWIHDLTTDGLMTVNPDSLEEWLPGIAERYEAGKDGLSYTFFLRKGAKFHDGKPVTAEDVKFSFDHVKDPKFKAIHRAPYYENIEKVEIVDPQTVKFHLKEKYFGTFQVIASKGFSPIVPKHVYGDPKKNTTKVLVGSGPYKLKTYNRGKNIILEKNKDWWGNNVDALKGRYNFDRVYFRFVKERNLQMAMLEKGQLDLIRDMRPEDFATKTKGDPWGKTAIAEKVENLRPKPYGFVAWNNKDRIFKSKNVRIAMAHLMNRDLMIEKFQYDLSKPATGPWYYQSPYANPNVKPIPFSPEKAQALLKKEGWADTDNDGVLDKKIDGKQTPFKFTLLLSNRDSEKYFTLYKEDLKKNGIVMDIKLVEWNSLVKALDEQSFEAVTLAWGGGSIDNDPKQIWHSGSAKPGGSNFISYSNPKVDKLIDEGRKELDRSKRIKIWQEVYRLIAEDAPYAFMFNRKYELYGRTSRMGMVKPTYKNDFGYDYWWLQK